MGLRKLGFSVLDLGIHKYICKYVDGGREVHFMADLKNKTSIPTAAHFQPKQLAALFFRSAFLLT